MFAEKGKNLTRMEANPLLNASARAEVRERDPGVLVVPHNRLDRAERKETEQ